MLSKEAMFEAYKHRLMTEGTRPGETKQWTRYNVIQYLCQRPGINPDEMAAALTREGMEIMYDDSSISTADNATHRRRVERLLVAN